jgi:putative PIN family toxin of toxin-antitoxin system
LIEKPLRVVIDTNVFVSAALRPGSVSDRAVIEAVTSDTVLASKATLDELQEVVQRPKFNKTRLLELRLGFLARYLDRFETVQVFDRVAHCRDPKDNKFLELALSGKADFLITGDADLLSLHPWRGIAILSPADFRALSE